MAARSKVRTTFLTIINDAACQPSVLRVTAMVTPGAYGVSRVRHDGARVVDDRRDF